MTGLLSTTVSAPACGAALGRGDSEHAKAVEQLHQACGVYTLPAVAGRILDQVGWCADADLTAARLLEPAAGAGEFVAQAGTRVVESFRSRGVEPRIRHLRHRITAFEIHPDAAHEARERVRKALRQVGVHCRTADACASTWVRNADFLLAERSVAYYSHIVGNPPYVRWSKVPAPLKSAYEDRLAPEIARGDLFIPFLDRSFDLLAVGGTCGFLCSDRWLYMAFAASLRAKWLPLLAITSHDPISAAEAFDRRVDTYPAILIANRRGTASRQTRSVRPRHGRTLEELGCTVRAGPALGHTPAFVLERDEAGVECELLHPWLASGEVGEGQIAGGGRRVIVLFDDDGRLVDLRSYPNLERRLRRYAVALRQRAVVRRGGEWYRTIDRVRRADWAASKLLVPDVARVPRVAIDRTGAIPSHGLYAIFPPPGQTDAIYAKLGNGQLAIALKGIAPTLKNGYVRCYKHFLTRIRV